MARGEMNERRRSRTDERWRGRRDIWERRPVFPVPSMCVARAVVVMMPVPARDLVLGLATAGSGTGLTRLLRHRLAICGQGRGHYGYRGLVRSLVEDGETEKSAGPVLVTIRTDVCVVILLIMSFHADENARGRIRRRGSKK